MSELKAKHVVDVYDEYSDNPTNETQVYLKSEAGKVIAEKDAKIIQLEALIENYNRISGEIIDNANHQKRKRCLAMAKACAWEQRFWGDGIPAYERQFQWENRAAKWKKRWLKIAEKIKEGI